MTNERDEPQSSWDQYYQKTAGRLPREFLARTLECFEAPGLAIDLGCGSGIESIFLLRQGWRVLAIDKNEAGIQTLLANAPPDAAGQLQTLVAPFEAVDLPSADLVWAGLSLNFCHPDDFNSLWRKIHAALRPNGRFAGDFFGSRHAWFGDKDRTFHTKEQVLSLCHELQIEYFVEEEGEQQTPLDGIVHWHMFTVRAVKP